MNRLPSIFAATLLLAASSSALLAQQQPAAAAPSTPRAPGADRLTPSELEELLGPIALYPDPLLANVLAASVYPNEVFAAAKLVASGPKPGEIEAKSWEPPVKAVAEIPEAIKMMNDFQDWTIALGQAYILQAKDVMDVVQTLRKKASENGALKTTPQQKVMTEQQTIYIQPADPEIIYVPSYNPSVVYVDDNSDEVAAGLIGFGVGITAGLIIANNMDCHWHSGCVGWGYGYHGGGNQININGDVNINRNNNTINNVGNNSGNNNGNRIGNEGNAWAPNKSKSLATQQSNRLGEYKAGATGTARGAVPGARPATTGANRPGGGRAARRTPRGQARRPPLRSGLPSFNSSFPPLHRSGLASPADPASPSRNQRIQRRLRYTCQ